MLVAGKFSMRIRVLDCLNRKLLAMLGISLVALAVTACSLTPSKQPLQRKDIVTVSMKRQDLEWVNDVSRRVLVDPKIHDVANKGIRPLVDSVWYAVIDEARENPTGPRRSFAGFADSLDGLEHDEKSRRVHAWFLRAGWALWGRPNRKHPDMLLRLTGSRISSELVQQALEQVFDGVDAKFTDPWIVNVATQPMMAWSSPGVPVINRHQVANIAARMYGNSGSRFTRLQRVVAGLTMVEEAVQWRMSELSKKTESIAVPAQFQGANRLTARNTIQIIAMAVAFNIDRSAFDLYNIQMQQCKEELNTDDCRHLIAMSELIPKPGEPDSIENSRKSGRLPVSSANAALLEQIRQRYTAVAQQLLQQIY